MTVATVTGPSTWIAVAAFTLLCLKAVRDYRRICKRDVQRLAKRNTRRPEPWPWPPRADLQKSAPALHHQPGARRARS